MSTPNPLATDLLAAVRHSFQTYKGLADKALGQLTPAEWFWRSGPETNSAAIIVQHLVGNLRSRFGDFWTTDGEKPDRNRDQEFEEPASAAGIAELQARWEAAWPLLWAVLDHLEQHPADWLRTVTIRQEPHTVLAALERQVAHYAYHTGQLVQLAKTIRGEAWQTLSIARGRSAEFNAQKQAAAQLDLNLKAPLGV